MRGGVAEEHARSGARSEFVRCRGGLIQVAQAPEDTKVGEGGVLLVEKGIWDTEVQGLAGAAIY